MDALYFFLTALFFMTVGFVVGHMRGGRVTNDSFVDLLQSKNKEIQELSRRYYELLYSVEQKFSNETRHETALRYIRNTERQCNGPAESKQA